MVSERPGAIARLRGLLASSLRAALDQSTPFGRLALVHCLQAIGTTLVTISLAGTLFFSISPDAAKSRVLLYLLLTIAPFALVGPALSPLLDKSRKARRTSVALANLGSALACVAMARSIHDLLLFPAAFVVLVLGKLYLVARAAIVPTVAAEGEDLATINARLAVLAALAGSAVFPIGVGLLQLSAVVVLVAGAIVFGAGAFAALRLPRPLAPAGTDAAPPPAKPAEVAAERHRLGLSVRPHLSAAIGAMSVARASVGFVEFFLAFGLRRAHAASFWFAALLVVSAIGSLGGSAIVPRLRRYASERQILLGALVLIALGGFGAAVLGGVFAQLILAFAVGAGPTGAKPALDSLVQRTSPPALLGRTFGRIETRLQLSWVIAALFGVLIPFPLIAGDLVVAIAALVTAIAFAIPRASRAAPGHRAPGRVENGPRHRGAFPDGPRCDGAR